MSLLHVLTLSTMGSPRSIKHTDTHIHTHTHTHTHSHTYTHTYISYIKQWDKMAFIWNSANEKRDVQPNDSETKNGV